MTEAPEFTVTIKPREELEEWHNRLELTPAIVLLLGGDRWNAITHAAVAEVGKEIVGIATIAPKGEQSGEPTIVALYVWKEWRRRGIGTRLLEAAIEWMVERGLAPIRVDALSPVALGVIQKLSAELREKIRINDCSSSLFAKILD
jgi:GNAT superfamily N-acetyltransferase